MMLTTTLSALADEVGDLQGRLRLASDDASPALARALTDAADLLDEADRLLCDAGIGAVDRRDRQRDREQRRRADAGQPMLFGPA